MTYIDRKIGNMLDRLGIFKCITLAITLAFCIALLLFTAGMGITLNL